MPTIPAPRSAITSAITHTITRAITRTIHAACLALAALIRPPRRKAHVHWRCGAGVGHQLPGITSVTIDAVNPPGIWDFLIDTVAFNQSITSVIPNAPPPPVYVPSQPAPITIPPQAITYTEPDFIDERGHKQKGKTRTVLNQVINYGDDGNDAKGHFETLTSPVPEAPNAALLLAGLAAPGLKTLRRARQAGTPGCAPEPLAMGKKKPTE